MSLFFLHKDGKRHFIIVVFPKLSTPARDFMKASEGKNGCLLFVCNVGLFLFEVSNGGGWNSNYGGASYEGAKETFV